MTHTNPDSVSDHPDASDSNEPRLARRLFAPDTFGPFISDCSALVAAEMSKKGMALRTAFGLAQKVKPDIVDRTVRELMPDFVAAIEPFYSDWWAGKYDEFGGYLVAHDDQVADAMLGVTDRRAERIHNRAIRSAYNRLRGRAQRELVAAMPGIASVIEKHGAESRASDGGRVAGVPAGHSSVSA